jgi:hypothetical protein
LLLVVVAAAASPVALAQPAPVVHHDLVVTLDPPNHRLKVRDRIRIPAAVVAATISLNADLSVQAAPGGPRLLTTRSRIPGADTGMDRDAPGVPVNVYRVEGANPGQDLTLGTPAATRAPSPFPSASPVASLHARSASRRA